MACQVPVVGTICGDCSQIIGDARWVVPTRTPDALGAACAELLSMSREARERIGVANRHRIVTQFSVGRLVEQTRAALEQVGPATPG
jgi:glycosyltransferase involved in cell wall biosynthesis